VYTNIHFAEIPPHCSSIVERWTVVKQDYCRAKLLLW